MASHYVARRTDGKPTWLYAEKDTRKKLRDVRWGDFLQVVDVDGEWTTVRWGRDEVFIRTEHVADQRPLELIFVDVAQGDSCIVVSPDTGANERILVVDAGQHDNTMRLLSWRFGKFKHEFGFHAAVITHPDQDHYGGFDAILDHPNVRFAHLYHNGIVEKSGADALGASDGSDRFLVELAPDRASMDAAYAPGGPNAAKKYGKLMRLALDSGRVEDVSMLSTLHGQAEDGSAWMTGFAPSDARGWTIEVLGPVPEPAGGAPRLRWFGDAIDSQSHNVGKTKNGHSVLLRVSIGGFRAVLGGDLNRPAEDYLLRHHSGIPGHAPLSDAVAGASAKFGADLLKCCHHGATDVTDEFLQAVNPFAFVVSSGDAESYAHPRPDLLGRLGKHGRGASPLVLCTEILRSTRAKGRPEDFKRLRELDRTIDDPGTIDAERKQAKIDRAALQVRIEQRNVAVFGAITVRTDGDALEISFMLEESRGKQRWQIYRLARVAAGEWVPEGDDGGGE